MREWREWRERGGLLISLGARTTKSERVHVSIPLQMGGCDSLRAIFDTVLIFLFI
jgi:hypothetical protein